jgi:subtilisin family serine protease
MMEVGCMQFLSTLRIARMIVVMLGVLALGCVCQSAAAQSSGRKVVKSEADLPRFNYPISGTASELVKADDATFRAFAAKVRADVESVLKDYDIEDHAAQRQLLGVELDLQLLAGENDAAMETVEKLRALEDKPAAKLMTGLMTRAMVDAQKSTGQTSGDAYEVAFAKEYAAALDPLPWGVVGDSVKQAKARAQIITPDLVLGSIAANVDPAVEKAHALSNDLAWGLIGARLELKRMLPLEKPSLGVLTKLVAEHNVQKVDIWQAREMTLTGADHLTPVRVAIWDSGTDLSLFAGRVYTDPKPGPDGDPHDIAFDLKGFPSHGYLYPMDAKQKAEYPGMLQDLKGLSDLQLSLDTPEAATLRKQLAGMKAAEIPQFLEDLEFVGNYAHGTHVAGIASRGNPAVRLAVGRITFDWHNVPLPPSEEMSERNAKDYQTYVDWFKKNGVRVVNMSWGGGPQDYEVALEKNGMGKDAAERKATAAKLYGIDRKGLYDALKSAPGILFICAAGNADSNSTFNEMIPSSFNLPNLLTVGAVDQAGDEASFTSYGPTVRVDADGYEVESVVPGGAKVRLSGTSMASPNVVNLAAKLLALDPKLTPEETIHLIVAGATTSADGRRHNIDEKKSVELLHAMGAGSASGQ